MKGIQSKYLRKKLRDRRLTLTSAGSYNQDFNLTIRLTNIKPTWSYGLKYAKGNIYRVDSWEEMRVNIVISGVHRQRTYTQLDDEGTYTFKDVPVTEWNKRNSEWCNRQTRRTMRNLISDAEYSGRYDTDRTYWGGSIGIKKLLQLFGIPNQNIKIGTIRFED